MMKYALVVQLYMLTVDRIFNVNYPTKVVVIDDRFRRRAVIISYRLFLVMQRNK